MKALLLWLRANPVAVTDALKAIVAVLAALGVPITSGASAAIGGLLIVLLSIWTQYAVGGHVEAAVTTATESLPETVSDDAGTPVEAEASAEPLND